MSESFKSDFESIIGGLEDNGVDKSVCKFHLDVQISHVCIKHEKPVCSKCIQDLSHNECTVVPILTTKDVVNMEATFKNIQNRTDLLINAMHTIMQKKTDNVACLEQKFENITSEINIFRQKMIARLDRFDTEARNLLERQIQQIASEIGKEKQELQMYVTKLKVIKQNIEELKITEMGIPTFCKALEINQLQTDIADYLNTKESLKQWNDVEFNWTEHIEIPETFLSFGVPYRQLTTIEDFSETLNSCGRVPVIEIDLNWHSEMANDTETAMTPTLKEFLMTRCLFLKSKFDALNFGQNVQINRGCFVSKDHALVKDMKNKYLYLLNLTTDSFQTLTLDYEPLDIALYNDSLAVVTLREGGIQTINLTLFELGQPVTRDGSFYAVACMNGKIYVRSSYRKLLAMNITGNILRIIETEFAIDHMIINQNGIIYCTNYYRNRVFSLTIDGEPVFSHEIPTLKGPVGVVVDKANNVYVAGWISNNIHQFDENGSFLKIIGSEEDDIYRPMDLSYNRDGDSLMVINRGCISIAVYEIKDCN